MAEGTGAAVWREAQGGADRMTVGELIEKLQSYDSALQVAVADWNEDYAEPSLDALDRMSIETFIPDSHSMQVTALVLGLGYKEPE